MDGKFLVVFLFTTRLYKSTRRARPDPDYLQTFTRDLVVQRYICDKIFTKMRSVASCEVANRQTNARYYVTRLAEVRR